MRNLTPFLLFAFLLFSMSLSAQVIWAEPAFPTADESVIVYFDATQGTGGLANCNCEVYVHTGLITSFSTSSSDWKHVFTSWGQANPDWQMDPVAGQPNVYSYEITPNIREKYNVTNPDEEIQKLAFVFRNGDGSLEGKDEGGSDIFYDVYPDNAAFTINFLTPTSPSIFTAIGEDIPVEAAANQSATLSLYDNGDLLTTVNGDALDYTISVSQGGTHLVELIADNGSETATVSFTYVVPEDNVIEALPAGTEAGINYLSDTEVVFALVAPNKDNVFLIGDF